MTITLTATTSTTVAAEARAVVKTFGKAATEVRALDGADLRVDRGRFTAIMGPSGSGKSTLMHVLAGLDTVDSGQVLIGDTDLTALTEDERTLLRRERVGFVFQSFNLVPSLTAAENITLPLTLARRRPDPAWLEQILETVGITGRLGHRPSELSGGQQQRVAVARALVAPPEIVFADEPTGNLDSRAGEAVLGLLRHAADELGQTVVMVTHDPGAAARADRVVLLMDGRVVDQIDDPTSAAVHAATARLGAGEE